MSDFVYLRSDRLVEIRPIAPADAPQLRDAFAHLSPDSRYQRFLSPKHRLSSGDLRYLTEVDGVDHVALIATPPGEPHVILGVGRYVRPFPGARVAEFAVTVGDPFQGEGLGSVLLERLADAAVLNGIDRFTATMLAENLAAHRLTRRLRGRLAGERHLGPVDELEVQLVA